MSDATEPAARPAALHPQCAEAARRMAAWGEIDLDRITVEEVRAFEVRRKEELAGMPVPVAEVRKLELPGGDGTVRAWAYRPHETEAAGVLVWFHGGGWVGGTLEITDDEPRALAQASGCVVLAVEYRLAPEHPFPAGLEDAFAAVRWAASNAGALGAAQGRLAVGGGSAGGNLAASVALLARDRGGPRIDFQLLVVPVTCRHLDVPSRRENSGYWPTMEALEWCWKKYLPDDRVSPYASPLLADSLAGLPPAFVLLAECDVLRDEGLRYAERMASAGVPVEVRTYAGMLHGFTCFGAVVDAASEALEEAGRALRAGLVATPR